MAAEGGDVGGAEEKRTVHHVVEWDYSSFGVGYDVVLAVNARDTRWFACAQSVSFPYWCNGRSFSPTSELADCRHELDKPCGVAHGVVEPKGEDKPAAFQPRHLHMTNQYSLT